MRECRGFYMVIEAADWLSAMWRSTETQRNCILPFYRFLCASVDRQIALNQTAASKTL